MAATTSPKMALVGCGPWGKNLAHAFAQAGVLKALVDIVPSQAAELAGQLKHQGYDCPSVITWEDALEDTSIDAIALATPAPKHAEMAISCLAADKHVFVEKPLALSVKDAQRIIDAAATAKKLVMVGHLFRYHPAFLALQAIVHQGRLGNIQHIHSRRLGFGRIRQQEDASWSLGVHDLSMILALAGDLPPTVTGKGFHHVRKDVSDVVSAELVWASGLQAQFLVSWLYPQKERKLIVIGNLATAVFDDLEPWEKKLRIFDNKVQWSNGFPVAVRGEVETVALEAEEPLLIECQDFLDCVQTGRQPKSTSNEALQVIEILSCIEDQTQDNFRGHSISKDVSNSHFNGLFENINSESQTLTHGQRHGSTSPREGLSNSARATGSNICNDYVEMGPNPAGAIPLIDLTMQKAKIQNRLNLRLAKVFHHAQFILGPEVRELEARLADYSGAAHVVTCGSGTAALTLALLALGLRPGDAVLVPDFSFVATVEAVALLGGVPVFVDVEPKHLTIDPSLIDAGVAAAAKAGHRAVGIIAVDLYGHPADYDALHETATRHNLWIIGDAAQSFGGSSNGRRVGSLTSLTTTSFFPSKPLGCYGDGGAIFTNDGKQAELLRSLRQHGLDGTKSNGLRVGLNSRLDTIQAAVLLCKLDILTEEISQREIVAERYSQMLRGSVEVPTTRREVRSAWAAYTIRTKHRDIIMQQLEDHGIAYAIYYAMPFHKQHAYQHFPKVDSGYAITEQACSGILSLPMGPNLNLATQTHIVAKILCAVDSVIGLK